jgi:hypothetical protein
LLQQLYPFLRARVRKKIEQQQSLEAHDDRLSPLSDEFLNQDVRNLRITRMEIRRLHLQRKFSLHVGGRNAGILHVSLTDGTY